MFCPSILADTCRTLLIPPLWGNWSEQLFSIVNILGQINQNLFIYIFICFSRKRQPDRNCWRRSTTRWTSSRRITLACSTPTTTTSVTGWTRPNPSRNKSKVSLRAVSAVASRHYLKILYFQLDLRTPSECESSSILLNQTALERKLQGKPGVLVPWLMLI